MPEPNDRINDTVIESVDRQLIVHVMHYTRTLLAISVIVRLLRYDSPGDVSVMVPH